MSPVLMMRIILLTHYFEPENGAPQRRWSALIERFVAAGHSVFVFAPPPHYPSGRRASSDSALRPGTRQQSESGATVYRVHFLRHSGDIATRTLDHLVAASASYRRASRVFRASSADVIIATAPALETLISGHALARRLRLPLVAEMRDAWPDLVAYTPGMLAPNRPASVVKQKVHRLVTVLQRRSNAVVTTTATFASVLRERGIDRVKVIRNGTDLRRYSAVEKRVRGEGDPLRVLYMGTIGRSQGLDRIIHAAARMAQLGTRIEVRIVGSGADVGRLRKLNRRLGSPVQILGQIAGSAVLEHYRWADSTVVSLRDWTPFAWTVPSKLYELLATGKHVTAIVAGEAAEIVRKTRSGHVVSPGDTVALADLWTRLAANRSLLDISSQGQDWVARYADYDQIAADYLALLESVVQGTSERTS